MKIISKFSDYYDCGLAYGIDEKLTFIRKSMIVDESYSRLCHFSKTTVKNGMKIRISFKYKMMGFCGNFIPFVYIIVEEILKKNKVFYYKFIEDDYLYDVQSIADFLMPYKIDISDNLKSFFSTAYYDSVDLFQKYKVPYFLLEMIDLVDEKGRKYTKDQCRLLPSLKEYRFVKVRKPIEAFQEISMYLGTLQAEDDTIVIDDKYLAKAKGYDCYSFKKLPNKRRGKCKF